MAELTLSGPDDFRGAAGQTHQSLRWAEAATGRGPRCLDAAAQAASRRVPRSPVGPGAGWTPARSPRHHSLCEPPTPPIVARNFACFQRGMRALSEPQRPRARPVSGSECPFGFGRANIFTSSPFVFPRFYHDLTADTAKTRWSVPNAAEGVRAGTHGRHVGLDTNVNGRIGEDELRRTSV